MAQHPPVLQRYASKLQQMGVVNTSEVHALQVTAALKTDAISKGSPLSKVAFHEAFLLQAVVGTQQP